MFSLLLLTSKAYTAFRHFYIFIYILILLLFYIDFVVIFESFDMGNTYSKLFIQNSKCRRLTVLLMAVVVAMNHSHMTSEPSSGFYDSET